MWEQRYWSLLRDRNDLLKEWNGLVKKINAKGGASFLASDPRPFDEDDIKRLLMLCHPDKHDGKQMAVDMTKKLLALRS